MAHFFFEKPLDGLQLTLFSLLIFEVRSIGRHIFSENFVVFMFFPKVCSESVSDMVCIPPLEPFKSVTWDLSAFSQCHA